MTDGIVRFSTSGFTVAYLEVFLENQIGTSARRIGAAKRKTTAAGRIEIRKDSSIGSGCARAVFPAAKRCALAVFPAAKRCALAVFPVTKPVPLAPKPARSSGPRRFVAAEFIGNPFALDDSSKPNRTAAFRPRPRAPPSPASPMHSWLLLRSVVPLSLRSFAHSHTRPRTHVRSHKESLHMYPRYYP